MVTSVRQKAIHRTGGDPGRQWQQLMVQGSLGVLILLAYLYWSGVWR
jgi:hypothetical protein